jgi:hypothetical protein
MSEDFEYMYLLMISRFFIKKVKSNQTTSYYGWPQHSAYVAS